MANKGIKGITINFSGDTRGLDKALKDVDAQSRKTQAELKEIEKASKLDPTSVELYGQKQHLLSQQITTTSQRLDTLKQAQEQVEQQFRNGNIGEEQYRAFQRELVNTEAQLKSYQAQMQSTSENYTALKNANKDLQTFFEATGTEVSQFSDVLGTRLTNAIREGTASTDQINKALKLMGRQALGSSADMERMQQALRNINASGLEGVRREFGQIAQAANDAGDKVNGFGDSLTAVAGGLLAGGGLASIIEQALDVSSLNTNIDISMNLNESDTATVRAGIGSVVSAIGDEEAAYEGVRRQMTLNKNASMETNMEIIKGASMVSRAYKEVDFKELIQESHEVGKELGVSQQEALALTNQLLGIGFPPEQLDIIAEYGGQLQRAGFNAQEIQAIMAAGVETGTWNIDNLLDGLKEGRIRAAEMGQGLTKAQREAIDETGISIQQMEDWGVAVAKGGETGNKAFQAMTQAVMNIDDEVKRNEVGVMLFGTMWEDQGENIAATILNMNNHLKSTGDMQKKLNDDVAKMEADPAYRLAQAMNDVKQSLAPVLADIAEVVASIADWVSENPKLTATIAGVTAGLGILIGAFATLMPAIGSLVGLLGGGSAALGVLGSALAVITGPIGLTVAGLAALGVGVYAVSQELSESSIEVENWSDKVSEGTAKAVGSYLDLENQATTAFKQIAWSGETVTQEMADKMIGIYDQMGQTVLTEMQADHQAQLQQTTDFYAQNNVLTEAEEAEILAKMKEKQAEKEQATIEGNARIKEIWETASKEKRAISETEQQEINLINETMKNNAIKHLSESERDQKVILENLKTESSKITATQAAEVVKNSKKQRDETIKQAEEQYDKTVKNLQMQRDEMGIISEEQYQKLKKDAENTKKDTIKNAEDMHSKVVTEAKNQAKEHVNEVDWETGEVKTKWQKLKEDTGKAWDDMRNNADKAFGDMYKDIKKSMDDASKWVGDKIDDIKEFFNGLKLKIPKPEMPKMPSFSLKTSTKELFGKSITFPSGLDVNWNAKGGVFDSPTIFATPNAGFQGVGEAGKELIAPLTPKVLAGIGKGISDQMSASTNQVIYMQPAPIYLDGQKIAEVTFDTINGMQYRQTNFNALTKGVNTI